MRSRPLVTGWCSLPHRQLRNNRKTLGLIYVSSLPHRQLRN
ncbi:hypothetical protein PTUN_a1271 [Pseudoalteromonas tunicata]|nr:hypothetical protein PTUN_a1271 [Pseudoalteromonas tunicata]